jgi:thiol-disulfide isomerase/thioredoxin
MDQVKARTRSDPKVLYGFAAIMCLTALFFSKWEESRPTAEPKLIHWYSASEARSRSLSLNKPILYVFSAAWCGPCKLMEGVAFGRKDIADVINNRFVPVLVMDQKQEKGSNPPEVKQLQDRYEIEGFPTLIAVAPKFIDSDLSDLLSTGNRVQRSWALPNEWSSFSGMDEYMDSWLESSHSHVPFHVGYSGPQELAHYLTKAYLWHRFPPDRGEVSWKTISAIKAQSSLPKMIVLIEDRGRLSDRMRIHLFDNSRASQFINKHFLPILIEFERGKPSAPEAAALKEQFDISQLPAIVVDDGRRQPQIADGFSGRKLSLQFLGRAAGVDAAQLEEETAEDDEPSFNPFR